MGLLVEIVANHSGRTIDLASAAGFSIRGEGASIGAAVAKPLYATSVDGETILATGSGVEQREQQYPLIVTASSVSELQQRLDVLDGVLRDVTRWGGVLRYRSAAGVVVTRFRLAAGKRSVMDLAEYEAFGRAQTIVAVVCASPFGESEVEQITTASLGLLPAVVDIPAPGGTTDALLGVEYTGDPLGMAAIAMLYATWAVSSERVSALPAMLAALGGASAHYRLGTLPAGYQNEYEAYSASLGRTAAWRLNGDGVDATGGGRTITLTGGPTLAAGALLGSSDGSLAFNGTSMRGEVAYHASLNQATFSVDGWIWRDADTGLHEHIMDTRPSSNVGWGLRVSNTGTLLAVVGTGSGQISASMANCPVGRWVHAAVTYDGDKLRLYADGVLVSTSVSGVMAANTTAPLRVGVAPTYVGNTQYWNGRLDELTYRGGVVLTDAQIRELFVRGRPALDASGNNRHLGMVGQLTTTSGLVAGDPDTALSGFSTSSYLRRPWDAALNPAQFTVGAVVTRASNPAAYEHIVDSRSSANVGYRLAITDGSKRLQAMIGDGTTQVSAQSAAGAMPNIGQRYVVIMTYDGTYARLYLDGVLLATSAAVTLSPNLTAPTIIGASAPLGAYAGPWTGTIDEPFVLPTALTDAQVASVSRALLYRRMASNTAPLVDGYGPGLIPGDAYDPTLAATYGTKYSIATDAKYRFGRAPRANGKLDALGALDYPILPHLFTPDDGGDEVDVAVYAHLGVSSAQAGLSATLSVASEINGTLSTSRRYGSYKSSGKALKIPTSGTEGFRAYFLGVVTLRVNRSMPRREWLRVHLTDAGSALGYVSVDFLALVPLRRMAGTPSGTSFAPRFATNNITKKINPDLSGVLIDLSGAQSPDAGIGGQPLRVPSQGGEMLVWPTYEPIDLPIGTVDVPAPAYAALVRALVTPRVHVLRQ